MIHIKKALALSTLFYPTFIELNGAVFLASELPAKDIDFSGFSDKTAAESFYNHIHILDHFQHGAALDGNNAGHAFWDCGHPDFRRGCELAKIIALMWRQKLSADFPDYRFRIYYTEQDNPIVRFHRIHEGEANWLDEKDWINDIAEGKIIIYDIGVPSHNADQ